VSSFNADMQKWALAFIFCPCWQEHNRAGLSMLRCCGIKIVVKSGIAVASANLAHLFTAWSGVCIDGNCRYKSLFGHLYFPKHLHQRSKFHEFWWKCALTHTIWPLPHILLTSITLMSNAFQVPALGCCKACSMSSRTQTHGHV